MRQLQCSFAMLACAVIAGAQQLAPQTARVPLYGPTWTIQAREVINSRGSVATRGITVEVSRDNKGQRYFYSSAEVPGGSSWTTIESWSKQNGTPVLAIYRAGGIGFRTRKVTFAFEEGRVTVLDSENPSKSKVYEVPTNEQLVLSQFNPAMFPEAEAGAITLMIFEPEATAATPHHLRFIGNEHTLQGGERVATKKRYELSSNSARSVIKLDEEGRFNHLENSLGQTMRVVPITEREYQLALGILGRAINTDQVKSVRDSG